jgi:peptidoglycan/LPS O-acetylase OafA/YrhL
MDTQFQLGHRPALEGLRGIAILLVMAVNFTPPFLPGGFAGVDLFFVLSGFLITCLLWEEWRATGGIGLKRFYGRRALRLLPALAAFLVFCLAFSFFQPAERGAATRLGIMTTVLYCSNWAIAAGRDLAALSHTWSLSVEEQFYLLWPPVLLWLLKQGVRPRTLAAGLLSMACLVGLWRGFLWQPDGFAMRLYAGSDTRADALLAGCALALWMESSEISAAARRAFQILVYPAVAIIVLAAVFVHWFNPGLYLGGYSAITLAGVMIVFGAMERHPALRFLEMPWLRWMGRISYGLYLWHYPILRQNSPAALRVATAIAAGAASYYMIEMRFTGMRRRLKYQRKDIACTTAIPA